MDSMGDRAAYSASQPLFDALRIGLDRLDESRQLLALAMQEVRNEHVQAKSDRVRYGIIQQEQYVDRSVAAWRSITDAFSKVFQEMSSLTEPNLAEGRAERSGHKLLGTLHQTAVAANCAAQAFPIFEGEDDKPAGARTQAARPTHHKPQRPVESKAFTGGTTSATPRKRVLSDGNVEVDAQPSKVRITEADRPVKDQTRASGPHTTGRGQPREPTSFSDVPMQRSTSSNVQKELEALALGRSSTGRASDQTYNVKYEDVSAEVEARLQAKDQKRQETKGEMKRKRNSTQSTGSIDGVDMSTPQNESKPRRKKARKRKSGGDGQHEQDSTAASQGVKRNAVDNAVEDVVGSVKRVRVGR